MLEGAGNAVGEWEWSGSAGRGWECRSGSGLVVLEVLEGRSLLEIYVHQYLLRNNKVQSTPSEVGICWSCLGMTRGGS